MPKNNYFEINLDANIIEEMGLKDLDEEEKEELLKIMSSTVANRVIARILDDLTEDERKELEKLLDEKKYEEIEKFIRKRFPNFDTLVAEETLVYKAQMIKSSQNFWSLLKK